MAKKLKVLGPANDRRVPRDEITLAKLVQNAKALGLKHTSGAFFRNADDQWEDNADFAVACCAIGASKLSPDTERSPHLGLPGIVTGNDHTDDATYTITEDYARGFTLGRAFREAMT